MNTLKRISIVLIAVPLVATLWSSYWMIPFVQPERTEAAATTHYVFFSYENFVHEAGIARLTIALIGLLILLIPYRKGERWALAALFVLIFVYEVPVFVFGAIPNLGTWPIFRNWPGPESPSLAEAIWSNYLMAALSVAGLALGSVISMRRRASAISTAH